MKEPFDKSTWTAYRGQWVAVKDGQLCGSAPTLAALYELLSRDPEEYDLVAQVPAELYDFDAWLRLAREEHQEFRRRLRG
ncbi:MAG TPA: DUF5678 domain-containing protein [Candidatus Limnocylindria bacterium]|nr:DUF5678 domain-containing protein [Candidatus Limnocylindria bacterium]